MYNRSDRGFTLIELLVVIGIILILMAIMVGYLFGASESARRYKEMQAANSLIRGWYAYSQDNSGKVIRGYWADPAADRDGNDLGPIVSKRYVFRLAPYLDFKLEDTFLVNQDVEQPQANESMNETHMRLYRQSVFPSLGISAQYVGGHEQFTWYPYLRTYGAVVSPTKLIVFASARSGKGGDELPTAGYHEVRPPKADATFNETDAAAEFGFVDLRWNGQAIASMVDGHVEVLGEKELKDMTRWSNRKFNPDRPNWR